MVRENAVRSKRAPKAELIAGFYCLTSSTRRLRARPSGVSFDSFGRVAPKPAVVSFAGLT